MEFNTSLHPKAGRFFVSSLLCIGILMQSFILTASPAYASEELEETSQTQTVCVPNPEDDLSGSIMPGSASASIANASEECSYPVGFAVYQVGLWDKQQLFDSITKTINPGESLQLQIDWPSCRYQLDIFYGDVINDFGGGLNRYGERLLDAEKVIEGREACGGSGFKITGKKFDDMDGNGEWNKDTEAVLNGWQIILEGPEGLSISTTTGADGFYGFYGLAPGGYKICEETREGWIQTFPATDDGCHHATVEDGNIWRNFGNQEETTALPTPTPIPTVTPTPSSSPTPSPSPSPSAIPTPSPTPEISPTPTVEPSPSPSPIARSGGSPPATSTPLPNSNPVSVSIGGNSPVPSASPTPSPSPVPSVSPSPSPSAIPTVSPIPSSEVSSGLQVIKSVRNVTRGEDGWQKSATVHPSDIVEFRIEVYSTGEGKAENVYLRDFLPEYLSYAGNAQIDGVALLQDVTQTFFLGDIAGGEGKVILFRAQIASLDVLPPDVMQLMNVVGVYNTEKASTASAILYVSSFPSNRDIISEKEGRGEPLAVGLRVEPTIGDSPLDVVLTADVIGTAQGEITYRISCGKGEAWDSVRTLTSTTLTEYNLCLYETPGTYKARVQVTRGGYTAESERQIEVRDVLKALGSSNVLSRGKGGFQGFTGAFTAAAGVIGSLWDSSLPLFMLFSISLLFLFFLVRRGYQRFKYIDGTAILPS